MISFEVTLTILQRYLEFNIADVTSNVADVSTLCELLPSIEDKSAFLYGSQSCKARKANIVSYCEWNWLALQVKTLKYHRLHNLGDTSCVLHEEKPAFGPAFAILSLETYVAHQNNDFFCQRVEKKWQFLSIPAFFTELAQLT